MALALPGAAVVSVCANATVEAAPMMAANMAFLTKFECFMVSPTSVVSTRTTAIAVPARVFSVFQLQQLNLRWPGA
ncbi:hypothetical protein ACU4GD_13825 [Cupriavidus basilensis]